MYAVVEPIYDKSILSEYPYIAKDQIEGEDEFDKSSLLAYTFRRNVERRGFSIESIEVTDPHYRKVYKICNNGIPFAYVESFNYRVSPFPEFGVILISDGILSIPGITTLKEPLVSLSSFIEKDPHGPVIKDTDLQSYLCTLHKKSTNR